MITAAVIAGPAALLAATVLARPYSMQPKGRHARPPKHRYYRLAVRSRHYLETAR